ncbi:MULTISPECIES: hypothetical protein [Bacillus amyloliquefaciens group]|uniref:hypothetical protein n=1 Tax=Bacillus amyloliquefaciens group TaxID=1938374 RepID=UPI0022701AF6|nr:hypothetical protein [Bacillus velezensis]MCY0092199.1 hypothetical protein [Bacillus velezensis]
MFKKKKFNKYVVVFGTSSTILSIVGWLRIFRDTSDQILKKFTPELLIHIYTLTVILFALLVVGLWFFKCKYTLKKKVHFNVQSIMKVLTLILVIPFLFWGTLGISDLIFANVLELPTVLVLMGMFLYLTDD